MALKKRCYSCGEYYYKDLTECPGCGDDNLEAQLKQDKMRRQIQSVRSKQKLIAAKKTGE